MFTPPVVKVDLSRVTDDGYEDARADRRALWVLEELADGTRVTVDVGNRTYPSDEAVQMLRRQERRLTIQIEGRELAPGAWHRALRGVTEEVMP